ncbi:MAG TPA: prolyl oligopeptidase family serine peptidase, partial [Terriglobales bacterium]|nr:prolyl oligopeptidase family serine peptidase [Terriglobales bacterium]
LIPQRVVPWSISVVNSEGPGHPREIWHSGNRPDDSVPPEYFEDLAFHFVGDRILFSSEQDGRNHLYSISAAGGEPKLLTAGAFDVEDVTIAPDHSTVLFTSNQNDVDRRHIWRVPLDGSSAQRAVTRGETIEWSPVETPDGTLVCLGSSATTPAMPYRVTSGGREMIASQALPADFPSGQLVAPRQVIFKSGDGLKIHGQLFVPRGRSTPGPALLWTHGGPIRQMLLGFHYMNYYHDSYALNEYLASRGYVVLSINYRLGIMYGRAFREAANAAWRGASEYQDVVAAGKYLESLPIVDRHRIGLWGGSYGGFLTAMGLARNSDIFSAGVDFHGVHDWSAFLERWEYWEGGTLNGAPDLEAARKLAFDSSPVASISTWKSPVLLIQGDDDRNVPFNQTVDLAQRLRQQHVSVQFLVFPDEIHDFLRWSNWLRAYQATSDFFDQQLKGGESSQTAADR